MNCCNFRGQSTGVLVFLFLSALCSMAISPNAYGRKKPTANEQKLYDAYVAAGRVLYGDEKYAEAIVQFEKAYEVIPDPKLYFNLAQSHRLSENPEKALEYYRKFLNVLPTITDLPETTKTTAAADVRKWIDQLEGEKRIREEQAEKARLEKERKEKDPLKKAEETKGEEPGTTPGVPSGNTGLTSRWWFWTGIGLTTVLAAGTVWAGMEASRYNDDWKKNWQKTDRDNALLYQDITDIALIGAVSIGIAVSVASWLHVRNPSASVEGTTSHMALIPGCDGSGCMLTFTWQF